jgi:DNA (cytosine-5)-methyltransferase 1
MKERAHPLQAHQIQAVILRNREGKPGGGKGPLLSEGKSLTLGTTNDQVLFTQQRDAEYAELGVASTLSARDYKEATDLILAPQEQVVFPTITMGAHPAAPGLNGQDAPQMAEAIMRSSSCGIPRRLTPVECERLMGWPDGWTDVPDEKGKPAPDTARYKACGNGVASPVAAWIGFRLRDALTNRLPDETVLPHA